MNTNSMPSADGNDLISDKEFFGESLDEGAATDSPPTPELKPLSRLTANPGVIPDSSHVARICQETARPANGATLEGESHGLHELVIKNGTSEDTIVKLRPLDKENGLVFYVHRNTPANIPVYDGKFSVLFMQGRSYSERCREFMENLG